MMTPSPNRVYEILEEHRRSRDLRHFVVTYGITHKPISMRTWIVIKKADQMDRILKRLKSTNKV